MSKRTIVGTIVAGVLATAIGIVLSYTIKWFPPQASTQAHHTDTLYHVLVIASVPIFVLVVTVILFSVWQFRMKPGEEEKDGPPIHGNTRLEVLWTVFPAVLLLGLVSYSFVVLHENEKKPAREMVVEVTGRQFAWSYAYPRSVTGGAPLTDDTAVRARQRIGRIQDPFARCDPRLLDPRLPATDRRRPGHYHQLPGDARPVGLLSGRVQPAVWRRALADALDDSCRDTRPIPGLAETPDEHTAERIVRVW